MKEKIFVSCIIGVILLTLIVSITVGVNIYNNNKVYVLDATSNNYMEEENALKAKTQYDTKDMKQEFIEVAENISNVIYSKLFDGSVVDDNSLKKFVKKYNEILSKDNWDEIGLTYPVKWIGTWYIDDLGFLKFKFATKEIEPSWVNDNEVMNYLVIN